MAQVVTITAQMADGAIITERTADFGRFAALVLAFKRDSECVRLVWREEEAAADGERAQAA